MDFLNPKVLGEEDFFRQRYRMPIERYGDMSPCGTNQGGPSSCDGSRPTSDHLGPA